MNLFKRKTVLDKEWLRMQKQEQKFLQSRMDKKENALDARLAQKVPKRLRETLDAAFSKAFTLVFEKETGVIEKTYRKDRLEQDFDANWDAAAARPTKKTLRAPAKNAARTGRGNMMISGAAGIGMGAMGVGLPDVPLFTAQLLRNLYEIALHYGYGYESERERCFILLLICGGLSYGDALSSINAQIDRMIEGDSKTVPTEELLKAASKVLSRELLCMKFLQGIPIVGVVGGWYDMVYMKRVNAYASLKYQRRRLHDLRVKKRAEKGEANVSSKK